MWTSRMENLRETAARSASHVPLMWSTSGSTVWIARPCCVYEPATTASEKKLCTLFPHNSNRPLSRRRRSILDSIGSGCQRRSNTMRACFHTRKLAVKRVFPNLEIVLKEKISNKPEFPNLHSPVPSSSRLLTRTTPALHGATTDSVSRDTRHRDITMTCLVWRAWLALATARA